MLCVCVFVRCKLRPYTNRKGNHAVLTCGLQFDGDSTFGPLAFAPSSTKVVYMTDSQCFHNTGTSGFFSLNPSRLLIIEIYSEMCPCGVDPDSRSLYGTPSLQVQKIRTVLLLHGMKPRMLQRTTHTPNSRVHQLLHTLLRVIGPFPFFKCSGLSAECRSVLLCSGTSLTDSKQNFTIYQVRPHFNGVLKKGNKLKLNTVKT